MRSLMMVTMAATLAGCTAYGPPGASGPPPQRPGDVAPNPAGGTCDASGGQPFIGRTATLDVGRAILSATHAKLLRWQWPGMMMTMEFSAERVNVSYADDLAILAVTCG